MLVLLLLSRVEPGRGAKGDDGGGVWGDAAALDTGDQADCADDVFGSGRWKTWVSVVVLDGDEGAWDVGDEMESNRFGGG